MNGLDVDGISPLLKKIRKRKDQKSLGTDYKDSRRFQKIRQAIKDIRRKNSGK